MKVDRTCKTCEWNFDGACVTNGMYNKIEEFTHGMPTCSYWDISLAYFSKLPEQVPWYLKNLYDQYKISINELIKLADEDDCGKPIPVNIYDAVEHEFNLHFDELAKLLDVSAGVIGYARLQKTIERRKKQFAVNGKIKYTLFSQ